MIKVAVMVFGLFLVGTISYNYSDCEDCDELDKRFYEVSEEVEEYGGAMIVTYNTETGEIIGKRSAYEKESGVFSVRTDEEANMVLGNVPNGVEVFVIERDVSPSRVVEVGGSY